MSAAAAGGAAPVDASDPKLQHEHPSQPAASLPHSSSKAALLDARLLADASNLLLQLEHNYDLPLPQAVQLARVDNLNSIIDHDVKASA